MKLYCLECQQAVSADELCRHRNPVGDCCCSDVHANQGDEWDGDAA